MTGGNRNGPNGEGPKTGRGLGYCSGSDTPGYTNNAGMGTGRGLSSGSGGFGKGRGYRRCGNYGSRGFRSAGGAGTGSDRYAPEEETGFLENRINILKQEIASLTKRLNGLRPEKPSKII
ncbi:MAG: DUF5320 domain-containing protein [Methanosarcinaceae archaeon]|nr:DUF5320 domain-containing protein [Methanosarcinaceae archaeon]